MRICILGAGWVGLVSAGAFARHHQVTVCDIDSERISLLRRGDIPFFEEGLLELLREGVDRKYLRFEEVGYVFSQAPDAVFCAVGTPQSVTGDADVSAVFACAEMSEHMFPKSIFVVKSTVPPGTCAALQKQFPRLHIASNPEFLAEGTAVNDALHPARIVFGVSTDSVRRMLFRVYAPWSTQGTPLIATDCTTSELAKYAANAFLATKISFVNELSEFAEAVGADMESISQSMGYDPRIGSRFLAHGIGYGGSCFPKDTQALVAAAHAKGIDLALVREAEARNMRQRMRYLEKIVHAFVGAGSKGHIAVLGVAYKPGTSDIRSSPAQEIIRELLARHIPVRWFDPMVERLDISLSRSESCEAACQDASVIFIATEWDEIVAFARTLVSPVVWGRSVPSSHEKMVH